MSAHRWQNSNCFTDYSRPTLVKRILIIRNISDFRLIGGWKIMCFLREFSTQKWCWVLTFGTGCGHRLAMWISLDKRPIFGKPLVRPNRSLRRGHVQEARRCDKLMMYYSPAGNVSPGFFIRRTVARCQIIPWKDMSHYSSDVTWHPAARLFTRPFATLTSR